MKVLVSFNGGRTEWQTRQAPPPQGDVAGFAVAPGGFEYFRSGRPPGRPR